MMNVKVVIPTIKSRSDIANSLALRTGGELIIDPVGDGTERSATDNHVRALLSADKSSNWVVVLEDDADPIDNFVEILNRQLETIDNDKIVSLYLGQQRPAHVQKTIKRTVGSLPKNTAWLKNKMLYWGVGVCIPTRMADSVAEYALTSSRPWDTSVGVWALTTKTEVWYTWPSMVDHLDDETTIRHADGRARESGRKAWNVGEPAHTGAVTVIK